MWTRRQERHIYVFALHLQNHMGGNVKFVTLRNALGRDVNKNYWSGNFFTKANGTRRKYTMKSTFSADNIIASLLDFAKKNSFRNLHEYLTCWTEEVCLKICTMMKAQNVSLVEAISSGDEN